MMIIIIMVIIIIIIIPYSRVHQMSWTVCFWASAVRVLSENLGISELFSQDVSSSQSCCFLEFIW